MINALWITLIGMGLVFAAILLLWGLMALLVRLTAEKETAEPEEAAEPETAAAAPEAALLGDRKRRAAAAAVSVALALRKPVRAGQTAQPGGSLSAWQAVNRANQISQRFNSSRKKVMR